MKKFLGLLAIVAMTITSCTKDDHGDGGSGPEAMAKTSVTAFISSTAVASPTGKSVNRGAVVPAWVDKITINASNPIAAWNLSETYDMVGSGGASNFVLDNVALGVNNFSATSTTNTTGLITQVSVPASGDEALFNGTTWKGRNPYVKYHSSTVGGDNQNILITAGGTNLIKFGMIPDNGRTMALFQLDENALVSGYTAKVTATISKAGGAMATLPTTTINSANSTIFYWSDEFAVTGARVNYKIEIYSGTNLVRTIERAYDLKNGDSNSCIYSITQSDVVDNQQNFVIIFQQMNDTNNCGYDSAGWDICSGLDSHGHGHGYYDENGHGNDGCVHQGPEGPGHQGGN